MTKTILSVIVLIATALPAYSQADKPTRAPRHIFVLHDGLHTIFSDPNPVWATDIIRYYLIKHGVPERDIFAMDFPFPLASLRDMFPKGALTYYLASSQPDSQVSQDAYRRLHRELLKRGVRPEDKLIWIGHSAGGQVGMTMAHLAGNLADYPDLARETAPHPFDMVVTLGSPLQADLVPASVKQRHYYSPSDFVVHWTTTFGPLGLRVLGYEARIMPTPRRLSENTIVRIFAGFEHADWPADRIVCRILAEYRGDARPAWRRTALTSSTGTGLAQLLCRVLEEQYHLSFEDAFEK